MRSDGVDSRLSCWEGEDHAFYQLQVPGCYVFLGSAFHKRENFFHHHPRFDFDEAVLPIGAEYVAHTCREWLNRQE